VKKIGLYFGTFNPIHKGHLALGIYFAEQTDLDQVWYVVSPQNPFKVDDLLLDDQHRLKMVRLALEDEPKLTASDIEFSLPKPNYTIHTLEHLVQIHPEQQFVLLMGEDNLVHFDRWKHHERILERVEVYVYPRQHESFPPTALLNHEKVKLIDAPKLEYTATAVREILKKGGSVEAFIPNASWVYMEKKGFYK